MCCVASVRSDRSNGTTQRYSRLYRSLVIPDRVAAYPITAYLPIVTFIYDACIPRYQTALPLVPIPSGYCRGVRRRVPVRYAL